MIVGLRAFEGRLTVKVSSKGRSEWQEMEGARWISAKLFAAYQQCSGAAGGRRCANWRSGGDECYKDYQ